MALTPIGTIKVKNGKGIKLVRLKQVIGLTKTYEVVNDDNVVVGEFAVNDGAEGIPGGTGVGIANVAFSHTDANGGNVYQITLTNATTTTFTAPKGGQGPAGPSATANTATYWETNNPILPLATFGYDSTNNITKIGDGVTAWKSLPTLAVEQTFKVATIIIDKTNMNPDTRVSYGELAAGLTPSRGNNGNYQQGSIENLWLLKGIRNLLIKDGKANGYLNKNNLALFEAGGAADITSGAAGNVFTELPNFWFNFTDTPTKLTIAAANMAVDGWIPVSRHKGTIPPTWYLATYKASLVNGKLASLSGKMPAVNIDIGQARAYAQANGDKYEQLYLKKLIAYQILMILQFRSTNSQTALGRGYVDGNPGAIATGGTNTKGLNFGENTGKQQAKGLGVEDMGGNVLEWVDGMVSDLNAIRVAEDNFNSTGNGYKSVPYEYDDLDGDYYHYTDGYIGDVMGTNELGFVIKTINGGDNTGFCDYGDVSYDEDYGQGFVPLFGGSWSSGSNAGAFRLYCSFGPSGASSSVGARLLFCGDPHS